MRRLCAAMLAAVLSLGCLPAPSARGETVLRIAPGADLTSFDPMGPAATQTYIHGLIIYDMLFALDENLHVHPQMVDTDTISPDRLTYTMKLRPGLLFHDNTPVRAQDVIASLKRWMGLDIVGRTMAQDVASMNVIDDNTFSIVMKRPFPVEQALANSGSGLPVIMREKEATAGRFTRDTKLIGSGPFEFVPEAFNPGDRIVYRRFPGYVPRKDPPNGLAGAKIAKVDELEFHVIPDAATKTAALQTGEVDFIDQLPFDQADILVGSKDITVSTLSKIYNPFFMRPNTLYPPFNDPRARQALALAINQADYMAVSFVRPEWGKPCLSFFVCGSPNGVTDGSQPYAKQNLARARQLLQESGYKGEPVILTTSHETLFVGMAADYAMQNLKQIGLNVQEADSDYGTFMTRRNSKNPPGEGGWNLFITSVSGAGLYTPLSNSIADTTCGGKNFAGWACDKEAASLRDAYIHEPDPKKQVEILHQLSRRLWQVMPTVILGQRANLYGWRNNITGFVHSPSLVTAFWNIEKH
ncbi:MAG TPA: ABC transporter substrate-binding protein [Rhodopila sp.]|uniref:ABC transporter substrate-binding protein n=1 Tax=Rhodopila sp. TaxID=2480087 RepID=UPI002C31F912|nr:ABC transporter substrate-binding protein [Rhodopila sp.]HVY14779.1 ABC transporter substrate-binding protein [Rhodopila sp.]